MEAGFMAYFESTFRIEKWDEKPLEVYEDGRKTSKASVKKSYSGDLEGRGSLEYLMVYTREDSAYFVGMEKVEGRIREHSGSFVLQHIGTFEHGEAKATLIILPGSGTGALTGLSGEGSFALRHARDYAFHLEYKLA
jgi:hypothetical protein